MNPVIELLKNAEGTKFIDEDGGERPFKLLPPLSGQELDALQNRLPCLIPPEILELLHFAGGFDGPMETVDFADVAGSFGMEDIFPCSICLAADGFGNSWVVDLTSESKSWGPIFFACHDAPVIVYQTGDLAHFVEEFLRFGNAPWKSEINEVHEELANAIWAQNPNILNHAACAASPDLELKAFAQELDDSWQIIDLRNPKMGDGFSWGRYGPRTKLRRFGEKRIFAYQKKSLGRRLLDGLR